MILDRTLTAAELEATHLRRKRGEDWWHTRHAKLQLWYVDMPEIWPESTPLEVWSVRVKEKYRGQGYGRILMESVCEYADLRDRPIQLRVFVNNEPAIRLYASVGFEIADGPGIYTMRRTPKGGES